MVKQKKTAIMSSQYNFYASPAELKALTLFARKEGISASAVIREALKKFIEAK